MPFPRCRVDTAQHNWRTSLAYLVHAGQPHLVEDGEEEAADEEEGERAAHHPSQREEEAVVRNFPGDA